MITIKSRAELELMREANRVVALVLRELTGHVKPGVTTNQLDALAEQAARDHGTIPAFKGYGGYPGSLCCAVNEQVVHGLPSDKALKEGDILSMDFGVIKDGFYGDSAITVPVGNVSDQAQRLMDVTRQSLMAGIEQMKPGNHLGDVSAAIQGVAEGAGFSVVRQFVGHGIGRKLHEQPQVPNWGKKGRGVKLKSGMVLAIEPMINLGSYEVKILEDGWTAVTLDGKLSAHFEHTVAVVDDGHWILSLP